MPIFEIAALMFALRKATTQAEQQQLLDLIEEKIAILKAQRSSLDTPSERCDSCGQPDPTAPPHQPEVAPPAPRSPACPRCGWTEDPAVPE